MADSRPYVARRAGTELLPLVLFLGCLGLGITFFEGSADGQTKGRPAQATQPVEIKLQPAIPMFNMASVPVSGPRVALNFVIAPETPLKDLLPIPPKARPSALRLIDDLSQVPEVAFQEPLAKSSDALKLTAHTMAKINHLNRKKADGFMEALLRQRPDLAGLPMAMGDACRMKGDRTQFFTQALATIKRAKGQNGPFNSVNFAVPAGATRVLTSTALPPPPAPIFAQPTPATQAVPATQPPSPAPKEAPTPAPTPARVNEQLLVQNLDFVAVTSSTIAAINIDPDAFWDQYTKLCAQEDKANAKLDPAQLDHVTTARIAALMQVFAPESVAMRKGLVKFLAATSHPEATRALAKLAIFSAEDGVRNPAIEALKVRREKDYTEILVRGLRYPLPAVAKRATEVMSKLERSDLVPELVNFLEEPDPRTPVTKDVGQKKVSVVRELVRINHHRNCLMCHSPAVPNEVPTSVTTAEVPRPDQPLPSPSDGYSNSIPEVLVRLDVTYLRQDFSIMQPVADARPWPEMQRFDYLVRSRVLGDEEASAFPAAKAGVLSPYQRFTLAALRELTGRDTEPTAAAWRKLVERN